jgi:hypothetical protein
MGRPSRSVPVVVPVVVPVGPGLMVGPPKSIVIEFAGGPVIIFSFPFIGHANSEICAVVHDVVAN